MNPQAPQTLPAGNDGPAGARECLSALLDGDPQGGDAHSVQRACALWREDGQARQDWHAWSLIGDVMRSDELAQRPERDAAFLARLRDRLATEPVVLAPAPAAPPPPAGAWVAKGRRQAWLLPTAVAAGFVAVAGVLVVARTGPAVSTPTLAAASSPGFTQVTAPGPLPSSGAGSAGLIRDAQLDAYLRAHQAARGGMTSAVPGGGMRNVEVTLSPGAER